MSDKDLGPLPRDCAATAEAAMRLAAGVDATALEARLRRAVEAARNHSEEARRLRNLLTRARPYIRRFDNRESWAVWSEIGAILGGDAK